MRRRHPAWRLLLADSAPLIASFLYRVFVAANSRAMSQSNLAEALDGESRALCPARSAGVPTLRHRERNQLSRISRHGRQLGDGFDALVKAPWVRRKKIHYWGDIDTHGFAILDQLRSHHADVESLLMDRSTLLEHRLQWSDEPEPFLRDLAHLSLEERSLFDDLRWKRLGDQCVRLEQERIGFAWVERALDALSRGNEY